MGPIIRTSPTKARQNFFQILKDVVNEDVSYIVENKDMKETVVIKKASQTDTEYTDYFRRRKLEREGKSSTPITDSLFGSLANAMPKGHKFISIEQEKKDVEKSYSEYLAKKYGLKKK